MVKSVKRILLPLAASLLIACGEQAEVVEIGPVAMPPDHDAAARPQAQPKGPRQVVLPEGLEGKYSTATMSLRLPGMAQAVKLELPLGGEAQQTEYGTLLVRDYLPAFVISGNTISSEGLEEKNPALWAEWRREGKPIFAGWLFRDYPGLNPVQLPDHELGFVGAK